MIWRLFHSLLFCLMFTLHGAQTSAADRSNTRLTFSCSAHLDSPVGLYTQALYRKALEPFGYEIEFIHVSATKELELLSNGRVDGSCGRAKQAKQHTDALEHTLQTRVPSFSANYYEVHLQQPPTPTNGEAVTALIKDNLVLESLLLKDDKATLLRVENEQQALAALKSGAAQRAILIDLDTLASGPSLKTNPNLRLTHFYSMPIHTVLLKHHSAVAELLDRRIPAVQAKLNAHPPHIQNTTGGRFDRTLDMVCHLPLDSAFAQRTIKLYDQALQKLQYNLSVRYVPRKRALEELRSGRTDLYCGRLAYFQRKVQQHAIQIPVPISTVNLHVYGLDPTISISSFDALTPADRVAYVQGSLFIEDHLKRAQLSMQASASPATALKQLIEGRADYYVGFHEETELSIRDNLPGSRIHNLGKLMEVPIYSFLQSKHQGLKHKLSHVLQEAVAKANKGH